MSYNTSYLDLKRKIDGAINSTIDKLLSGDSPLYLVESGSSVFLDQSRAKSVKPKNRSFVAQSPNSTILIKKKAFSTFSANNDLKWMDRTEKMLLRATKALFAYKVNQIRAYESLTKLNSFMNEYGEVNLNIFIDTLNSAKYLDIANAGRKQQISGFVDLISATFSDLNYDALKEDVIKVLRRNTFSTQNYLTSWIVDPDNVDNYQTGPGTGVIELCNFTSFQCDSVITPSGGGANFSIQDPYRILNIIEEDVEIAIREALLGTLGLLNDLAYGAMTTPPLDTTLIVSSAFELAGLGNLDPTIDVDYIRERLRVFYLGKTIINVGDAVHFYIKGNKYVENSQNNDSSFSISPDDSYFNIDDSILEAEKRLFTNNYIDLDTYKRMRRLSGSFDMIHVFGGFVKGISENFSPTGGNLIRVSCSNNMEWLTWSRYMEEPTLNDPRGVLEDPLTPYDLKKDETGEVLLTGAPELLQENKDLLRSGLLSFDSGILAGSNATESNINQGQYNDSGSLFGSRIIQHPQGLIYRWKTGVITATADVKSGSDSASLAGQRNLQQVYGMLVSDSAVSNLDVANAISTLVTGQPYNVETFTKLAFEAMNLVRKQDGSFNPTTALSTILNSIRNQNKFYGNFKPYRLITLSQKTLNQFTGDFFSTESSKNQISILRQKKNKIKSKIEKLKGGSSSLSQQKGMIIATLQAELNLINAQIDAEVKIARSSTGQDVSQVFNQGFFNDYSINGPGNTADYDVNRAMSIVSSQRRIEDVKLNRDSNYLIISDLYDANTEIKLAALNLKRQNFSLFKASYMPVLDRIANLVDVTGFEFFCNSQGHLELRPPLWNRTPLSVLNAMYKYQSTTNNKIVPDFLFKLFETRIGSLKAEISAYNIKIVILALLIGRYPDASLIPIPTTNEALNIFGSYGEQSLKFFGVRLGQEQKKTFGNDTNFSTGGISSQVDETRTFDLFVDIDIFDTRKDSVSGNITDLIGDFSTFFLESKPSGGLGGEPGSTNYDLAIDLIRDISTNDIASTNLSQNSSYLKVDAEKIESLRQQFLKTTGIDPLMGFSLENGKTLTSKDLVYKLPTESEDQVLDLDTITKKVEKIFGELEKAISGRNALVTILKTNLEKQSQLEQINDNLVGGFSETSDQDVFDQVFAENIGEALPNTRKAISSINDLMSGDAFTSTLFDHLIEDDSKNLLGPGSGRRYIIQDEEIEEMSMEERPPDYTRIDVYGQSSLIDEQLKSIYGGENLMFWAGATDFDLWRQYGYRPKTLNVPFSNSAEYTSKPLALLHMMMQRVKIFSGSVTLAGNEYYQPGDTVYIPSKGLLFYVTRVTHSFAIGSKFSTTLVLEYGHPPGIYLPTPIDIIGEQYNKQFLKNGDFINIRNTSGDDKYKVLEPDSCIIFPFGTQISENNIDALLSYKGNQVAFYNMITDLSTGILAGSRKLLIRGFVKDGKDSSAINDVQKRIDLVKSLFLNPVMLTQTNSTALGDDLYDSISSIVRTVSPIGNSKDLSPMVLPNGITAPKIQDYQIIEQIVYANRDASSIDNPQLSRVDCVSNKDIGRFRMTGKTVDISQIIDQFPKGGPKQSSIFKARDESENSVGLSINSLERTIEIGLLDLDKASSDLLASLGNSVTLSTGI